MFFNPPNPNLARTNAFLYSLANTIDQHHGANGHTKLHNIDSQKIVWSKPENNAQEIGVERCSVKNLSA